MHRGQQLGFQAAELGLAVVYVGMRSNVLEVTPPLTWAEAGAAAGAAIPRRVPAGVEARLVPDAAPASFHRW